MFYQREKVCSQSGIYEWENGLDHRLSHSSDLVNSEDWYSLNKDIILSFGHHPSRKIPTREQ